jgi:hypothetical protein
MPENQASISLKIMIIFYLKKLLFFLPNFLNTFSYFNIFTQFSLFYEHIARV